MPDCCYLVWSIVSANASVEINASRRAVRLLHQEHILIGDEVGQTARVLKAAALTYVASAAASILQLLRLLILTGGRRRDD